MHRLAAEPATAGPRLLTALLALVAGLALLGAGAATAAAPVVSPAVLDADVVAAGAALARYGTALRAVERPEQLRVIRPRLDREVRAYTRRVDRLAGYRLADRRLDRQRARLARTGPPVGGALRRFNAAAADGDLAAMRRLVPVVQRRITAFLRAAAG